MSKSAKELFGSGRLSDELSRSVVHEGVKQQASEYFEGFETVCMVTIMPVDGIVRYLELNKFGYALWHARHLKKLKRNLPSDVSVIGSADVSLEVINNEVIAWNFHMHLLVSRQLTKSELKRLRKAYPNFPEKGIKKAVQQDVVKEGTLEKIAGYVSKYFFTRRSRFIAKAANRNDHWDTNDQRMSHDQEQRLHGFLDQYVAGDFLILINFKRVRTNHPTHIRLMKTGRK